MRNTKKLAKHTHKKQPKKTGRGSQVFNKKGEVGKSVSHQEEGAQKVLR